MGVIGEDTGRASPLDGAVSKRTAPTVSTVVGLDHPLPPFTTCTPFPNEARSEFRSVRSRGHPSPIALLGTQDIISFVADLSRTGNRCRANADDHWANILAFWFGRRKDNRTAEEFSHTVFFEMVCPHPFVYFPLGNLADCLCRIDKRFADVNTLLQENESSRTGSGPAAYVDPFLLLVLSFPTSWSSDTGGQINTFKTFKFQISIPAGVPIDELHVRQKI